MRVLSLDPSFRNYGYVIFHQEDNGIPFIPIRGRVIRPAVLSAKELKARNKKNKDDLLKMDHRLNCMMEIFDELKLIAIMEPFDVILSERLCGTQSESAARSFGIADGILACLISFTGVPYYRYQNVIIKKAFTGSRAASKDEMILETVRRHPKFVKDYFPESKLTDTGFENICEHMADACGVMATAEQDPVFNKFVEDYWHVSTIG